MLQLFDQKIYYKRCALELNGMQEFEKFYRQNRSISGQHTILHMLFDENGIVFVEGKFEGAWRDGTPLAIQFADIFFFNSRGFIQERHTYTDQGNV